MFCEFFLSGESGIQNGTVQVKTMFRLALAEESRIHVSKRQQFRQDGLTVCVYFVYSTDPLIRYQGIGFRLGASVCPSVTSV